MKLDFYTIDKFNFVEFNTTGSSSTYEKLNQESIFLHTFVFNLFIDCFERSNELYEYFNATKYNARNIIVLQNELQQKHSQINSTNNAADFQKFINNIFLGKSFITEIEKQDENWIENWIIYKEKLLKINSDMINIIDKCVDNELTLWIIGY